MLRGAYYVDVAYIEVSGEVIEYDGDWSGEWPAAQLVSLSVR